LINKYFISKLILSLSLCIICSFVAKGQDSVITNKPQDLTIQYNGKFSFTSGRKLISYDSCKQRLMQFDKSALELQKALKFENRNEKLFPIFALVGVTCGISAFADEVTNSKTTWLNTTFFCLVIPTAFFFVYISINQHHQTSYLKSAIAIYNEHISNQSKAD
jgi:hypothetical protein